jgi:Predicted membrane protein/domain
MFCPSCGQSNTDNASNCISCGRPLSHTLKTPEFLSNAETATPPIAPSPIGVNPPRIYAAFWFRFLALMIDGFVVSIVTYTIVLIYILLGLGLSLTDFAHMGGGKELPTSVMFGMVLVVYVLPIVGSMLYYSLMESSSKQATLGKMAVGIKVTDEHGNRISWARAVGRFFAHAITWLTMLIGFVVCVFTRRQQTVHDLIAQTLVVYKDVTPQDLARNPNVPADTVQKVTAVGALVLIYLFCIAPIALALYFGAADIKSKTGASFHDDSYGAEIDVLAAKLTGYDAIDAVSDYLTENGTFPASLEDAGFVLDSELVQRAWINRNNGEITLRLSSPPLTGTHLMFYPERTMDGDWEWFCFSSDIDEEFLPDGCEYLPADRQPDSANPPGAVV